MKFSIVLCLALFAAVSTANLEVDWSNVRPIYQFLQEELEKGKINHIEASPNRRIVNGQEATPGQFPYQVALLSETATGAGLCGGSVISATRVLTAAHCTVAGVINYLIIAGAHDRSVIEATQQRVRVPASEFIAHPNYGSARLINDVAIVRVNPAFSLNARVAVTGLASDESNLLVGVLATVSGFGRYSDSHNRASNVVLYTRKTVITNAQCAAFPAFALLVVDSTICAQGNPEINNAVCNGDSGGPLTIPAENGSSTQIGVVSFGSPRGCETGLPDGYARISHPTIRNFIRDAAGI